MDSLDRQPGTTRPNAVRVEVWLLCQAKENIVEYVIAGLALVVVLIIATMGTYAAGRMHGRAEGLSEAVRMFDAHLPQDRWHGACPTCGSRRPTLPELEDMAERLLDEPTV